MKKALLIIVAIFASVAMYATTIHDIQYTTDPAGASPLAGQTVTVTGTVVGIYTSAAGVRGGFYLQDAAGAWNGIYVYAGSAGAGASTTCIVGDSVSVTAAVSEYNGLTELGTVTACSVIASGKNYTINDVTTLDAATEKWESCLVRVKNATCGSSPSAGNFLVNDGTADLDIFKQLFQTLALTTGTKYNITGIMTWYNSGSMFELYPRSADDVTVSTGFSTPSANVFSAYVVGKNLLVNNVANGSTVEIYSIVGAKVQTSELVNGVVEINNLSKGLYVVRVGKDTQKIML